MIVLGQTVYARSLLAAPCAFAVLGEGRVASVLDATTLRMADGQEIRLAGIIVPDKPDGPTPALLANLALNRDVVLRGPSDAPDRYGRQHAFVFMQGEAGSIQDALLSEGQALASATIADRDCAADLQASERAARLAKRGAWSGGAAIKNAESPGDILARTGQFTVVEGLVVSTRELGAISYINFGKRWSRDFAVTISKRIMPAMDAAGFSLKSLQNRRVRVRGWIEERGGPRIDVTRAGQIEWSDDSGVAKGQ